MGPSRAQFVASGMAHGDGRGGRYGLLVFLFYFLHFYTTVRLLFTIKSFLKGERDTHQKEES